MKRYIKIPVIFSCLFLCLCRQSEVKENTATKKTSTNQNKSISAVLQIDGILDISKDTIIVLRFDKMFMTTDFGKSWKEIDNDRVVYSVMIDDHNILWANSSGGGIHGPKFSRFFKSKDYGKNWETIEWDAKKFWPLETISKPHQALRVKTGDNQVYQLSGEDAKKEWKFLGSLPDTVINPHQHLPPYALVENEPMKLIKTLNNKTDTLLTLDSLYSVINMIKVKNTLYIAGSRGNSSNTRIITGAYLAAIINEKKIKEYKIPGGDATVVLGTADRIWAFNDKNLYLKVKDRFIKFY